MDASKVGKQRQGEEIESKKLIASTDAGVREAIGYHSPPEDSSRTTKNAPARLVNGDFLLYHGVDLPP